MHLRVIADNGNRPQKYFWSAQIVLATAAVLGKAEIIYTGNTKTAVWRWQARFAAEGIEGLLRNMTRSSRIPKPGRSRIACMGGRSNIFSLRFG